jgi:integrase
MESRGSNPKSGVARSRYDEIGRRPRHTAQRGCRDGARSDAGQHPRWCFTFSGKRIQQSSTAWDKAKQRAGIEDFRFHDLRHTWASWHVQSGTSLPELMELGGWKSYEMVLRYAHLAPEKLSFVAGRIERQASRPIEEAPRVKNVAKNATFSLRSVH